MDSKDAARQRFAHFLTTKCLRDAGFREAIDATNDLGQKPIIPALDDDPLAWVVERVTEAGGTATIATSDPGGTVSVFRVSSVPDCIVESDDCPVHPDATVGMLVAYLRQHGGKGRIHVEEPADYCMELLNG